MITAKQFREALARIGGLSWPAKMPCPSWSTPAEKCGVGSKLRAIVNSTCASCYAFKGCYVFKSTRDAMARRWKILTRALSADDGGIALEALARDFATVLTYLRHRPRGKRYPFFRWHDSGDVVNERHMALICRVAELCPDVRFWLPTREYHTVARYLAQNTIPRNLTVRFSVAMVDAKVPAMPGTVSLVHTDTVPDGAFECPAYTRAGECGPCRACWSKNAYAVSYPIH